MVRTNYGEDTTIKVCKDSVTRWYGSPFNNAYFDVWNMFINDEDMFSGDYTTFASGETKAVFIFDVPSMKNVVVKIPFNHEDTDYCALEVKNYQPTTPNCSAGQTRRYGNCNPLIGLAPVQRRASRTQSQYWRRAARRPGGGKKG